MININIAVVIIKHKVVQTGVYVILGRLNTKLPDFEYHGYLNFSMIKELTNEY